MTNSQIVAMNAPTGQQNAIEYVVFCPLYDPSVRFNAVGPDVFNSPNGSLLNRARFSRIS